ncbi:MAG: hypothetical protein IH621_02820 [Krumholzibacteria bacterium]|nr:hypothetical protein [Candidatus Krumholzibacteria bacterium]
MPIRYTIDEQARFVHAVSEGRVTVQDLLAHWDELAADPRYRAPMKKLVDYRRGPALALDREGEKIVTAAKMGHRKAFGGERCAIITPHDIDFGMSRVHGAHMDESGVETAVFRTLAEALAWLGLGADVLGGGDAGP